MNAKSLWQKAALPLFDPSPVSGVWLRIWWMLAALLLFPSQLSLLMPPQWALATAGIIGLSAAVAPLQKLSLKPLTRHDLAATAMIFPVIMVLSALTVSVWKKILFWCDIPFQEKQALTEIISISSGWSLVAIFAALCIITPVLEEILFRKFIYSLWHNIHAASAFAGTTLLFAIIHFFLSGLPGLLVLGCGFQYIFLKRKNLSCAILLHSSVNISAFIINWLE